MRTPDRSASPAALPVFPHEGLSICRVDPPNDLVDNRVFVALNPGKKEYLTAKEFRRTVRRNFGIMKEEWVKKYFQAFDRNHR